MYTDLRKKAKMTLKIIFLSWWTMQFIEKLWKMWEFKFVKQERKRNYLVLEPNYHTTKFFTEHILAIEMKKNADTYE